MIEKYNWNRNPNFMGVTESFIRRGGSPMGEFELVREEEKGEVKYFIVKFYEGAKMKREFKVQETLDIIPLLFFDMLKWNLNAEGKHQFY